MKLKELTITNFRGYKESTIIPFNDLTVFVGRNDVGKSTILEALDVFFHDGKGLIKIERADVNIQNSQEEKTDIVISATFCDFPEEVVLDVSSETTLNKEYLLNEKGLLEVIKKYHNGGSPKVFLRAFHPTNPNCADLLLKKNAELKKIVKEESIKCDNLSNNVFLREAIWNHYSNDLRPDIVEIDVSKEDAKRIWDKLSQYMPVYSLFQSDRKNRDEDSEVQDPLQSAVKQILSESEIQEKLATIADEVTKRLKEVSSRTLDKVREIDSAVAKSLNPIIPNSEALKWADVFKKVSISGDENIPINKRGSGVKRLILLSFFRAEAERRLSNGDNTGIIYAIEEPETSQHFASQKMLIQALRYLSSSHNTQVILTTHSGIVVKELDYSNLCLITDKEGKKQVLPIEPGVLQYPSLNEINYSAFGEISEEYHNELYGFLHLQGWLKDYKKGKKQFPYIKDENGNLITQQLIKTEIIRHQIHHPENNHNQRFTSKELQKSIDEMKAFIRSRAEKEGLWEPIEEY